MEEIEIWRAANQLLARYREGAAMEAAQCADSAYEAADLFNFNLWTRITTAVEQLQRKDRAPDESAN